MSRRCFALKVSDLLVGHWLYVFEHRLWAGAEPHCMGTLLTVHIYINPCYGVLCSTASFTHSALQILLILM